MNGDLRKGEFTKLVRGSGPSAMATEGRIANQA
jgi:hypothetical protein